LPKAYLNSPQLSLDAQALDKYFGTSITVDITQDTSLEGAPSCDQAWRMRTEAQIDDVIVKLKAACARTNSYTRSWW